VPRREIKKQDGGDGPKVKNNIAAILALNMKSCRSEDW